MKIINAKKINHVDTKHGNYLKQTVYIRGTRKELTAALDYQNKFLRELQAGGDISPWGCDCASCRADWDCCGHYILSFQKMTRIKRHVRIDQFLSRNL